MVCNSESATLITESEQITHFHDQTGAHNYRNKNEIRSNVLLGDELLLLEVDNNEADMNGEYDEVKEDADHKHVLSS